MPETQVTPAGIVTFWRDAGPDRWYTPDDAFDAEVRRRFLDLWRQAAAGGLSSWETSDDGALALVIVLDQFPRNMFRGDARTYASDALARAAANRAIDSGLDARIDPQLREFLYLPFMLGASRRPVALYRALAKGGPCRKREMGRAPRRDHPALQPLPPPQPHPGPRHHARGAGIPGRRGLFALMTDA
jgi:uncharacterized protein (DUF924 family)